MPDAVTARDGSVTQSDIEEFLRKERNWNRWGKNDEVGAVNLITPDKRVRAAGLVRSGRTVSLSRPFPTTPSVTNPWPAQHYMKRIPRVPTGGAALDYIGVFFHGRACTHLDALCHVWAEDGMWNGRDPDTEIGFDGARFGDVDKWGGGIVTRCLLLDVPRYRDAPYVTIDRPVHGSELKEIARASGLEPEPGDAIAVYCGREEWDRENPSWGSEMPARAAGLHASCLWFLREADAALLLWDMLDLIPSGYDLPWSVHAAIWAFGMGLVDNALLEPLARACAEEGRNEFMLCIAPLRIAGGTGSPINPLAIF